MLFLGSHCIDTGGIHMAARRAGRGGMQALQIFSAVPKYYNDKVSVKPERIARFREALEQAGIAPAQVIVHAAYVINTATPDPEKWARAAAGLAKEYERSTALGVGGVCFHPGAATDGDRDGAIARVSEAMRRALEAVPESGTRLLIENTAGAGTTVGRTPDEVAAMLAGIPADRRHRTGYGLDTCHLFASGYDLTVSRDAVTAVLDAFEQATGEPPAFLHLNDSEGACGSNKDRHRVIGEGLIGADAFGWLLQDPRARGIPCILETPQAVETVAEDDDTPDVWDVDSIARLRALAAG
ncbi:MAG: deoxyribonuclease IV [Gemmatimonas sp.]|uniref:deoxyribonuclease IV n=1 Tax=Gemmatimonas sp. UBA7669 TaxID=1946568 RepID=UPI0025BE99DF|nr:deoxyribonuclease IV [Gemmatimonas sp. UBA7669]MBA3917934.1 deoxyribonuclease IV [Gemmatimonas sp.]